MHSLIDSLGESRSRSLGLGLALSLPNVNLTKTRKVKNHGLPSATNQIQALYEYTKMLL